MVVRTGVEEVDLKVVRKVSLTVDQKGGVWVGDLVEWRVVVLAVQRVGVMAVPMALLMAVLTVRQLEIQLAMMMAA